MARDRRVLPHNLDAEASILGGVILRNEVLLHLEALETDDFYDHKHKAVSDAIGGIAFLGELTLRVPTADNVIAYTEIVRDHSQARKLILSAGEIVEKGF